MQILSSAGPPMSTFDISFLYFCGRYKKERMRNMEKLEDTS